MTNSSSVIYIVDLLTRNCESVWLLLEVNEIYLAGSSCK